MNRYDKLYLCLVLIVSIALFSMSKVMAQTISVDKAVAVVSLNDKEVLRIPMNESKRYQVSGKLGDVILEVKDGKIRVADEISPLHYCQLQGWVQNTNTPIVCLPNGIKIVIENGTPLETEEDVTVG